MTRTGFLAAMTVITALLFCGTTLAQTPEAAAEKLDAFLDRFPDLGPGYAVVVVTPDEVLLRHVDGVRRAGTGEPLTVDTPRG
jgi:CubicO group peptidase (beta-lactamase class C family)